VLLLDISVIVHAYQKIQAEHQILLPSISEATQLAAVAPPSEEPPRKKRKGPKGPNPLSVKSKKTMPSEKAISKSASVRLTGKVANTGEKRKHVADDEVEDGGRNTGHKRKRRRKTAPAASVRGDNAEADSG
jgi:U3 small nucleolar RNA-associated protein 23